MHNVIIHSDCKFQIHLTVTTFVKFGPILCLPGQFVSQMIVSTYMAIYFLYPRRKFRSTLPTPSLLKFLSNEDRPSLPTTIIRRGQRRSFVVFQDDHSSLRRKIICRCHRGSFVVPADDDSSFPVRMIRLSDREDGSSFPNTMSASTRHFGAN